MIFHKRNGLEMMAMLRGKRNEYKESLYDKSSKRRERKLDETNRAKIFGTRLSEAIKKSGLSTLEIEKRTLIDSATLYGYMRGTTSPKLYNVALLAKVLKTHIWDLYPL